MKNKRVLLKLSGETLADNDNPICTQSLQNIANEIKTVLHNELELSIVVGAGNFWRGAGKQINRVSADKIGMLATVMNAIAISESLKTNGIKSVVLCASGVTNFCETFSQQKADNTC